MKTLSEQIAAARATHDIRDVLGLRDRQRVIVCPLPMHVHKHNTPSFSIFWRRNMQWWRCHGSCDMEGDVVDLVGFLRVPNYDKRDPDKIRQALNLLGERYAIVIPQPEPELLGREWRDFVPPGEEVIQYAAARGLTLETLKKFRVGQYEHFMTMPCFEDGVLRGIKLRNIWQCEHNRRFWQLPGSRLGLFNFDAVNLTSRAAVIVKGEIPCMLMDQIGLPYTCAPTGGEGSGMAAVQRWSTALALSMARLVIGDNDRAGIELGHKRKILFDADILFPPTEYKDLDEWILADKEEVIRRVRSWEQEVAGVV